LGILYAPIHGTDLDFMTFSNFYHHFGWCLLALALIFLMGLLPPIARRFYPERPHFRLRLAAPVIFAVLACACFAEIGLAAMILTITIGMALIGYNRFTLKNQSKDGLPSS